MSNPISRRDALKQLGVTGAGLMVGGGVIRAQQGAIIIAGQPVEIAVTSLSGPTARITVRQLQNDALAPIASTGALVNEDPGQTVARGGAASRKSPTG